MFRNNKKSIKFNVCGFSLVEVLIVIIIISVLSVALFFTGKGHTKIAMANEGRSFIEKIVAQEKIYRIQHSSFLTISDKVESSNELRIDSSQNKYFKEFTVSSVANSITVTVFPVDRQDDETYIQGTYNLGTGNIEYNEGEYLK